MNRERIGGGGTLLGSNGEVRYDLTVGSTAALHEPRVERPAELAKPFGRRYCLFMAGS
jgi:hypothetical protein